MNAFEQALYARLTTTPALTALLADATSVHFRRVPSDRAYPAVVFDKQDGRDDNRTPRRARQLLYLVKAIVPDKVGATTYTKMEAGAIDDQIDAALHGAPLTVTGWSNYWLHRESDLSFTEDGGGGRQFFHEGGVYRARLSK